MENLRGSRTANVHVECEHTHMQDGIISYKPSAWYYRKALRETNDAKRLRALGLLAVSEMERLRGWCRTNGMIPPKWKVTKEEAQAKGWES